ncbi:ABC transporter permease [Streptomyces sp. NBC_01754]|uniref:ABC transporter permease n=1 Tax=Streptomyces sp. NBC_01754 TaxID=2975930 RepID=UPI002DD91812|nr:ABC transporter permease [Streptomyces sp. NBC_01754]WSC91831.1 ABC transporter permease [Streptomyces sp. NBC_01754]
MTMSTSTPTPAPSAGKPPAGDRHRSRAGEIVRRTWGDTSGKIAVVMIALLVLAALCAPLLTPYSPVVQDLALTNEKPSWLGGAGGHLLGTDPLGRDVLSRVLHGLRLSLAVGLGVASAAAVVGLVLGLVAGWYESSLGVLLMRLADIQFAVPFVAVGVAIAAVVGPGIVKLAVILAVWGWASYARTIVTSVSQVKRQDFVTAARTVGAGTTRLMYRHIAPNVVGPVIILWSTSVGVMVLVESALSLLGLGTQPPSFSLGSMLADSQTTLRLAWWAAVFPGLAIMLVVVAFNLLGDALRDAFNPQVRLRNDPELW